MPGPAGTVWTETGWYNARTGRWYDDDENWYSEPTVAPPNPPAFAGPVPFQPPPSGIQLLVAESIPYNTPGVVTSEQLRAIVEAPGYMEPRVPFLNMEPAMTYPSPMPPMVAAPAQPETPMAYPPTVLFSNSPANIETSYSRSLLDRYQGPHMLGGYTPSNLAGQSTTLGTLGAVGAGVCMYLPEPARTACEVAAAAARAVDAARQANSNNASAGGMTQQNGGGGMNLTTYGMCAPPRMLINGVCYDPASPAGNVATGGGVSLGIFGIPSAAPIQVGNIMGRPILRCGRGLVLGKDNRCYAKGSIPRSARKWAPEPKPLVSRSDVKALARIKSIRGRVKRAASSAGLTTTTRGRGTPRKGKK